MSTLKIPQPIGAYYNDIQKHCRFTDTIIPTGIKGLDILLNGGISNELYILGAETSTGKSAFMQVLAEAAASAQADVLYFALEMSKIEFVARGTSSIGFKDSGFIKAIPFSQILYMNYDSNSETFNKLPYEVYEEDMTMWFRKYGAGLYIIETGVNGISAREIAEIATAHKERTDRPVVVFVDYLQILRGDSSDVAQIDRKTKMDTAVVILKTLASQVGIPVIAASSIGRTSYGKLISGSSFKESGDVEYTGGILLGWNWMGVTNAKDETARTQEIAECKKRGYRKMRVEVLKYRNGDRNSSVDLYYYPAVNYFSETLVTSNVNESEKARNEAEAIPEFKVNTKHVLRRKSPYLNEDRTQNAEDLHLH